MPEDCWPIKAGVPCRWQGCWPTEGRWRTACARGSGSYRPRFGPRPRRYARRRRTECHRHQGWRAACDRLCEILPAEALSASGDAESAVESLFHRLNTGGKPLDGDDLAWSLLKARWPELEVAVSDLAEDAARSAGAPWSVWLRGCRLWSRRGPDPGPARCHRQ